MQLGRLPMAFEWQVAPADWTVGLDGTLHIVAGPAHGSLRSIPRAAPAQLGAPRLMAAVEGDFQLSAYVKADLQATFDAGALVLHAADHTLGQARARALPAGRGDGRLGRHARPVRRRQRPRRRPATASGCASRASAPRARCTPPTTACAGTSCATSRFAAPDGLTAGFLAQSPTGEGCAATFDGLDFVARDPGGPARRLLVPRPAQEDGSNASWRRARAQATCRHTKRRR